MNVIEQRARELFKLTLNGYQSCQVAVLRAMGKIDFPVPPNSNMRRTSAKSISHYVYSGITTYLPIATIAKLHGVPFSNTTRVLDFGCGVAGQLRLFTKHLPDAQYWACDVDPSSVEFVKKHYRQVHALKTEFNPPLPFESGFFDLVYSVSTFSHFDRDGVEQWISELSRIVKSNGLALLTVEGASAIDVISRETGESSSTITEALRRDGIYFKNYVWLPEMKKRGRALARSVDIHSYFGDNYGNTVLSEDFVRANWSKAGFEVLGIVGKVICDRQDLVILRKRTSVQPRAAS